VTERYPSKPELQHIEQFKGTQKELIAYLQEIWAYDEWGYVFKEHDNIWELKLHTGGWSGNESIIGALRETIFWILYWQKSERGGHYRFTGDYLTDMAMGKPIPQ
jgi:hypothetical protein